MQTYNPPEALANVPCLTHICFQPGSHVIIKCSEPDAFPPKHLILSLTFPFCASLGTTEQPKSTVSKRMAILGLRRTAPGTPWSPSAHASSKKWADLHEWVRAAPIQSGVGCSVARNFWNPSCRSIFTAFR